MTIHAAFPRSLAGRVRADADPATLFRNLNNAINAHVNRQGEQMHNLEAALQSVQEQVNRGGVSGTASHLPVIGDGVSLLQRLRMFRLAALRRRSRKRRPMSRIKFVRLWDGHYSTRPQVMHSDPELVVENAKDGAKQRSLVHRRLTAARWLGRRSDGCR